MQLRFYKNFLFFFALAVFGLLFVDSVYSDTLTDTVDVQMNVPSSGQTPTNNQPQISNVSSTASYTTAVVSWNAFDDNGVTLSVFEYGLTTGYGSSSTVLGSYYVDLSSLIASTTYHYRITVYDGGGLTATYEGTFLTSPSNRVKSLKIIAKPEKRVGKTGGNLGLTGKLVVYNPITHQTLSNLDVSVTDTGSTTYSNLEIGTGTGLEVYLKGRSHLAKKMTGVDIIAGTDVVLDFTINGQSELLAGDVQGSGLKDNMVDILDVSMTDSRFNSTNLDADLNRDGVVDVLDMSIVLVNYGKKGDAWPTS